MAVKVFICGLALVEYIGEGTYKRVGSSLADSATLKKGDFFITDKATAVALSGGTRFKWHKEVKDCDILAHFSYDVAGGGLEGVKLESELSDKEVEDLKEATEGDVVAKVDDTKVDDTKVDDTKVDDTKEGRVWTQDNIMDATDDELKALCKKYKIKYGKLKRDDMIGVLLPFLEKTEA